MLDFQAHFVGLDGWMRRFRGADKIVAEEMGDAGKRSGLAVERGAKIKVRKKTHHLERSITSTRSPFGTTVQPLFTVTRVGTTVPYARAQDNPTATPYDIRPKNGRFLVFKGRDGKTVFTRLVHHPGIRGNEYLTGTFRELRPKIRQEFAQVPKRVIARLKGGG